MLKKQILNLKNKLIQLCTNNKLCFKLSFRLGLVFFVILAVMLSLNTFSKYVFEKVYDNYLLSKEFYFYSNALDNIEHVLNDWDGESNYILTVDVRNYIDELRWTQESIPYVVSVSCNPSIAGSVECDANDGTINYSSNGGTNNQINITLSNPVGNPLDFSENDYVDMDVSITSTAPYRKTLSATFKISVALETIKYSITDSANQDYLDLKVSNFGNSTEEVSLGWDQTILSVDNLNEYIMAGTPRTTTINGKTYVNGNTLNIEARRSIMIRFYKADRTQNYTYPITNNSSIILVN